MIKILAGHDGKYERTVELEFNSRNEAEEMLNRCFGNPKKENLWVDNLGQEFSILEIE